MSHLNDETKMPTRSLRILIADADPAQALKIEKALNILGYYRIAPLYNAEALVGLKVAHTNEYDVLLISQDMAGGDITDEVEYRNENSHFRHVLMYADVDKFVSQLPRLMPMLDSSAQP